VSISHFAGTTTVKGMNSWREESSGGYRKLAEMVQTWQRSRSTHQTSRPVCCETPVSKPSLHAHWAVTWTLAPMTRHNSWGQMETDP